MRRAANQDKNHGEIAEYFERLGYAVAHTHQMAGGFPDLIVSNLTDMWLVEVKDGHKAKLTDDQVRFNQKWKGKEPIRINNKMDVWEFHKRHGGADVDSGI